MDLTRSGYISTTIDYQMTAGDVGYIKIRQFDATTLSELDYAIRTLRNAGAASLLFDLRDNAGGLLDAALNCIDLICPEGVMAWAESKDGSQEVLGTSSGDSVVDLPMVCLVNGNTASAAELFASCLRDMSGARLVGTTTYGKGTIQSSPQRLSDGSAVVVTVARLIASNGESFDTTGLTVDVERPLTSDEQGAFYDFTLETDPQILRAVNTAQTLTGSATVGGVNAASSQAASEEEAGEESRFRARLPAKKRRPVKRLLPARTPRHPARPPPPRTKPPDRQQNPRKGPRRNCRRPFCRPEKGLFMELDRPCHHPHPVRKI